MKISEWINQLPEPYRSLAINNMTDATRFGGIECDNFSEALAQAFDWRSSRQGYAFWSGVAIAMKSSYGGDTCLGFPRVINGYSREEFVKYLTETLIPDLKESGSIETALDFLTAVAFMSP